LRPSSTGSAERGDAAICLTSPAARIDDWASGDNACAALTIRHGVNRESLASATARHLPAMQAMAATLLERFVRLC
jgi:hypothetical protein